MPRRATLRASDSDREQVAERLRHAAAEGRILAEELEDRLGAALRARTYGELDPLIADLPRGQVVRRDRRTHVVTQFALGLATLTMVALVAFVALLMALWLITGAFALWMLWFAFGWMVLGRRRRAIYPPRHHRRRSAHHYWT